MFHFEPIKLPHHIEKVETDTERYYRYGNIKLISVTQLLEIIPNPSLDEWRERVGEEEAEKVSKQATGRGRRIHKMIEDYLLHGETHEKAMPSNREMFLKFKRRIDKHLNVVNAIEKPLISYKYKIAGTPDLIGKWDYAPSIIDHKTAKYDKDLDWIETYFLQETIYSIMLEECIGLVHKQLVVLIGVDHSNEAQVIIEEREKYEAKAIQLLKEPRC